MIRIEIAAGLLILLIVAFGLYTLHERHLGEAQEVRTVKAATAQVQAKADAQTAILALKAAEAETVSKDAQTKLDDYMAAHPVGSVVLCAVPASRASVPTSAPIARPPTGTTPTPGSLPGVPRGPASVDIGPGLALILSAAAELSISVTEFQSR